MTSPISVRHKVLPGETISPRVLVTIDGTRLELPDAGRVVHLQFRRFAGCPVCTLHLHSFSREHNHLEGAGIREVVVFHSTEEHLRPHTVDLPFTVIADPGKRLYAEFGVESSRRSLLDPRGWTTIIRAGIRTAAEVCTGRRPLPSLRPHGGRFGLPGDFLIASDGRVLASKYGEHVDDNWSVSDVLRLLRDAKGSMSLRRRHDPRAEMVGRSCEHLRDAPPGVNAAEQATEPVRDPSSRKGVVNEHSKSRSVSAR